MIPSQPSDEQIERALDDFLESLPEQVATCIAVDADQIEVNIGQAIETGEKMLMVHFTSPYTNEDGEHPVVIIALDEDAAVALLTGLHQGGEALWGDEDDDVYG